jgi:predicted permease
MAALLKLQFIIFSLIAIGFFTRRRGMVSREGQKNITDLVINLILPCNILTSFSQQFAEGTMHECLMVFLISAGIQVFCVIYGRTAYPRETEEHQKCLAYGIICSNAGFLGNPLAEGIFGSVGLMFASVYLIPVRVMMWSAGIAIFSGEHDLKGTMKKVATHPCVLACAAGLVMMVNGWIVPEPCFSLLQTIGRCNTAISMLVIGMILSDINPRELVDKIVVRYTIERLILIPLLVWIVLLPLVNARILSRFSVNLSVLLAAMPAGATTSMLAAKYECAPGFATRMVILSTLCSIPTIFLWSMVLA